MLILPSFLCNPPSYNFSQSFRRSLAASRGHRHYEPSVNVLSWIFIAPSEAVQQFPRCYCCHRSFDDKTRLAGGRGASTRTAARLAAAMRPNNCRRLIMAGSSRLVTRLSGRTTPDIVSTSDRTRDPRLTSITFARPKLSGPSARSRRRHDFQFDGDLPRRRGAPRNRLRRCNFATSARRLVVASLSPPSSSISSREFSSLFHQITSHKIESPSAKTKIGLSFAVI